MGMSLRNCRKCKKLFNYINSPYCPDCVKEEEDSFNILRGYIKENPKSEIMDVAEATGISEKKILRYIREGKLEVTYGLSGIKFKCDMCGKPITLGRYCPDCISVFEKHSGKSTDGFGKVKSSGKSEMYTRSFKK